jgi:small-conductance mechanosensitive channel
VDQYLVQHELRKRILGRFRREGIRIPYPQREVHVYNHGIGDDRVANTEFVRKAS